MFVRGRIVHRNDAAVERREAGVAEGDEDPSHDAGARRLHVAVRVHLRRAPGEERKQEDHEHLSGTPIFGLFLEKSLFQMTSPAQK